MNIALREATDDDLDVVTSLLDRYGLPTADVRGGDANFYLAELEGTVVGVGGLEVHGPAGLLRSVAVRDQGQGHGSTICDRLEDAARDAGVATLYLLTESAPGFFESRGYERIDRAAAPEGIRSTAEFSELCGDTAVCMRKRL